ncbi:Gfo/Idh/MocA family oxidoreductase [Amycolatopsis sp. CA-230715]|uniref:Gfo/Idh/MocA family oxidoreductase n=1 Tax=Amycolatopsis sp. CA-230715 TaxID=2745196 RepID=UPI001C037391|nr:Gfo/Idh/MocA family oxidoreductase [Amycolatopsis sp. CA-230715]QWF84796.1 hypothetical protein HUW46_08248 [Amycolatopsis sp. CA-230715]
MTEGKPRVVVCGTRFGQVYLEAFEQPDVPFELAGVLGTGSRRSRACAEHYGVPLYTGPDELPADIDMACVVIRGGLLGGRGSELATALLDRGIHVLQEHPLHHDELAGCLRAARRNKVVYRLNAFYCHQEPVRRFVAAARELLSTRPPLFLDSACGFQLAYSLLDVLARCVGGTRPWAFGPLPELDRAVRGATSLVIPFRSLDGVFAGIPITLRVQNQMDPADPDNYAHLMHRISIGTDAGSLTLVGTHGPVVWSARPAFPREVVGESADPYFDASAQRSEVDSSAVLGPANTPSYREVFQTVWPAGVIRALGELWHAANTGEDPLREGRHHLNLCKLWQELTARLGPPDLLTDKAPVPFDLAELRALDEAAGAS